MCNDQPRKRLPRVLTKSDPKSRCLPAKSAHSIVGGDGGNSNTSSKPKQKCKTVIESIRTHSNTCLNSVSKEQAQRRDSRGGQQESRPQYGHERTEDEEVESVGEEEGGASDSRANERNKGKYKLSRSGPLTQRIKPHGTRYLVSETVAVDVGGGCAVIGFIVGRFKGHD